MEFLIAIVAAAIGALAGAFAEKYVSQRQLKHDATTKLFQHFHSPEMLHARRDAWVFLNGPFKKKQVALQDISGGDDPKVSQIYHALIRVIYFWFLLHVNSKQKTINEKLARDMFGYHFRQWQDATLPLAKISHDREDTSPDWTALFVDEKLSWLLRK